MDKTYRVCGICGYRVENCVKNLNGHNIPAFVNVQREIETTAKPASLPLTTLPKDVSKGLGFMYRPEPRLRPGFELRMVNGRLRPCKRRIAPEGWEYRKAPSGKGLVLVRKQMSQ